MVEENISQKFRFKHVDEKKNYYLEEEQNELVSGKHKKVYITPTYIQHFLTWAPLINGWISISAFASLVGIPIEITSSAIGIKMCNSCRNKKSISQ